MQHDHPYHRNFHDHDHVNPRGYHHHGLFWAIPPTTMSGFGIRDSEPANDSEPESQPKPHSPPRFHARLGSINIHNPRGEVIDMWPFEAHNIRHEGMTRLQPIVRLRIHQALLVPSERVQRVLHKRPCVVRIEPALFLAFDDQSGELGVEDIPRV